MRQPSRRGPERLRHIPILTTARPVMQPWGEIWRANGKERCSGSAASVPPRRGGTNSGRGQQAARYINGHDTMVQTISYTRSMIRGAMTSTKAASGSTTPISSAKSRVATPRRDRRLVLCLP